MYRVIIVDDEPVIRRGLRETIEWDSLGLEVAGEAADGIEALKLIREIRPAISRRSVLERSRTVPCLI